MEASKEVLDFCERFEITIEQFYGIDDIKSDLYLANEGLTELPDGFNPTVSGDLDMRYNQLTSLPDGFNPTVSGELDMSYNQLTKLPKGFNPIVGHSLLLNNNQLTELPKGFNPTVGGNLDLSDNQLISLPDGFNPIVRCSLCLEYNQLTELPKGFNPIVGQSLQLNNNQLTSLPDGFNPTVGYSLFLRYNQLTELPKGFNPTIGGRLDLTYNQLTSLPDGFNPLLKYKCYIDEHLQEQVKYTKLPENYLFSWMEGKYIKVDFLFCEVIEHRGLVWKCKNINKSNIFYTVTDGNGKYAHGMTIKDAKKDLIYKISNRDKSSYVNLTLDSVLTFEDAIECYRVITGACTFGTKVFCKNKLIELKDTYTISEMVELTKGQYGNETFKNFFK